MVTALSTDKILRVAEVVSNRRENPPEKQFDWRRPRWQLSLYAGASSLTRDSFQSSR